MVTFEKGKMPCGAGTDVAAVNSSLNRSNTISYSKVTPYAQADYIHTCMHTHTRTHTHTHTHTVWLKLKILLVQPY